MCSGVVSKEEGELLGQLKILIPCPDFPSFENLESLALDKELERVHIF